MLQEASRKLGYSAKKTSKLAQDLYEGIEINGQTSGLITYMRTDSVSVSADAITATRDMIGSTFGDKYLPEKPKFYKTKTKNAQEAHEAIRPTNVENSPEKIRKALSDDHFKLYDLIWKRMVASQMENAVLSIVTVNVASSDGKANFRASGSTIEFDGFLKLYMETRDDEEDEDKQTLPKLQAALPLSLNNINDAQHFTQPPPRYTEASLVKRMEELGIGRPSTYPAIISILQDREYVKMDKKRFFPETKGRLVSSFLDHYFGEYFQYNFTANLEDKLDHVSNGEENWKIVLKDFWAPFKTNVDGVMKIKNQDILESIQTHLEKFVFDGLTKDANGNHACPTCKTGVLGLKAGKFGAFVGCSNYPECKFIHKTGVAEGTEDQTAAYQGEFPIVLGEQDGAEITIRKGPYGIYVQKTAGKDIKRVGLPKGNDYKKVDMEYAMSLLSLPRIVGPHPDGGDIKAGLGRFGPYVEYNKKFHSIKNFDPATISLEDAMKAINTPKAPRKGKK
jgi:DNA topoisomerase-1